MVTKNKHMSYLHYSMFKEKRHVESFEVEIALSYVRDLNYQD